MLRSCAEPFTESLATAPDRMEAFDAFNDLQGEKRDGACGTVDLCRDVSPVHTHHQVVLELYPVSTQSSSSLVVSGFGAG